MRARVHVRTDVEHADLFVRLCDVDPSGVSRDVVDGIRRLEPRTIPAGGRPCRFEVFADVAHPSRLDLPVLH